MILKNPCFPMTFEGRCGSGVKRVSVLSIGSVDRGGLDDMVVVLSLLLLVVLLKSEISFALRRLRAVRN